MQRIIPRKSKLTMKLEKATSTKSKLARPRSYSFASAQDYAPSSKDERIKFSEYLRIALKLNYPDKTQQQLALLALLNRPIKFDVFLKSHSIEDLNRLALSCNSIRQTTHKKYKNNYTHLYRKIKNALQANLTELESGILIDKINNLLEKDKHDERSLQLINEYLIALVKEKLNEVKYILSHQSLTKLEHLKKQLKTDYNYGRCNDSIRDLQYTISNILEISFLHRRSISEIGSSTTFPKNQQFLLGLLAKHPTNDAQEINDVLNRQNKDDLAILISDLKRKERRNLYLKFETYRSLLDNLEQRHEYLDKKDNLSTAKWVSFPTLFTLITCTMIFATGIATWPALIAGTFLTLLTAGIVKIAELISEKTNASAQAQIITMPADKKKQESLPQAQQDTAHVITRLHGNTIQPDNEEKSIISDAHNLDISAEPHELHIPATQRPRTSSCPGRIFHTVTTEPQTPKLQAMHITLRQSTSS